MTASFSAIWTESLRSNECTEKWSCQTAFSNQHWCDNQIILPIIINKSIKFLFKYIKMVSLIFYRHYDKSRAIISVRMKDSLATKQRKNRNKNKHFGKPPSF